MSDVKPEPHEEEHPPRSAGTNVEGRRRAAAVLEVLGGARTPTEAAESLGITLATYYLLEARALEGLVASCEPRPRGRSAAPAKTLQALTRENDRLRQDLTRTQALARAIQRASGMSAEETAKGNGPLKRSRRRPRARALRAARILAPAPSPTPAAPQAPAVEPPP